MRANPFLALCLISTASLCSCSRSATPLLTDIVATEKDGGRTFEVYKGSLVEFRLGGNATTGFQWELLAASENDYVLKETDAALYVSAEPESTGSGGVFVFRYMAANPGEARLRFGYRRSWEKPPPEREFAIAVKVKDTR